MRIHLAIFFLLTVLSGTLSSTTIHVPADYPTIQAAIDAAVGGDTVIVAPGTYMENLDFLGKAVTLVSDQGPAVTVIDGGMRASVVSFRNGEGRDSVLQGFTITNGTGTLYESSPGDFYTYGGGIFCLTSSPTIVSNIIDKNIIPGAEGRGGGIGCFESASPRIEDNTISGNRAPNYGGGIYGNMFCAFEVSGNLITANISGQGGGGYYGRYSPSVIKGNTITLNTSYRGGGIYEIYCSPGTQIMGNTISDNIVGHTGAGISITASATPLIMGNTITRNESMKFAGGMNFQGTDPIIEDNVITENKSVASGGGIRCDGYCDPVIRNNLIADNAAGMSSYNTGGGIYSANFSNATIENNVITGNEAINGAGIGCVDHATAVIDGNLLLNNTASDNGGGIYLGDCHAKVRNNIIAGNSGMDGGGMYCNGEDQYIISNTFYGNSAGFNGGAGYFMNVNTTLSNNILWDDFALTAGKEIWQYNCTLTISHCDIDDPGLSGLPGCFEEDPQFVDPLAHDFHLTFASPCRNRGTNSAPVLPFTDFEGDIRIFQSTTDVGADEFYRHLYVTGDPTPGGQIEGKFIGMPGTSPVGLFIGGEVLQTPLTTPWGEFHINYPYVLIGPLGVMPQDGVMVIPATLPGTLAAPYDVPLQGLIGLNPNSLSNLFILKVR